LLERDCWQCRPLFCGFLRFVIASAFLIFLTRRTEGRLPGINWRQAVNILFLGLTGIFAYNISFYRAFPDQCQPGIPDHCHQSYFISLFSVLLFKDRLSFLKIAGLCLSVTGALLVISSGHITSIFKTGMGKGELAIFGCVVSWVSYSLMGKPLMQSLSPMASVVIQPLPEP